MLILDATTRSLEIKLVSAITISQLPWTASYVDVNQTTFALTRAGQSNGATNHTTAVTMVAAPGSSRSRQLKFLSVQNADTVNATVIIQINDNGTTRVVWRGTLAASDVLVYAEARGFVVTDGNGALKRTVSGAGYVLPADVALTDAANVFTLNQTISKTSPEAILISGGGLKYRFGVAPDASPAFYLSNNLAISGSNWNLDDTSLAGSLLVLDRTGALTGYTATAGANPRTLTQNIAATLGTLSLTGGQVAFPATQNASADPNTLDDYEEGSWTPTLGGLTSESGQVYNFQSGRYIKIGGLVHAQAYLQFSNKGTITGGLVVKGLPFSSGGGSSYFPATIGYMTNMAAGTVNPKHGILGYIEASTAVIKLLAVNDFVSVNPTIMDGTDVNSSTQLIISVTYTVTT